MHSIYVVNKEEKLIGRLSLKDLLIANNETKINDIYIPKVDSVHVDEDAEEVAKLMAKYDLEAIPVINDDKVLLGRITIDDIVDVIIEEAEKDYQLAAGITQDVDAEDSILALTRARLPWLFLGLLGGVGAAVIMGGFETIIEDFPMILLFTPLIAAMAGNVGVASPRLRIVEMEVMGGQRGQTLASPATSGLMGGEACFMRLGARSGVVCQGLRFRAPSHRWA